MSRQLENITHWYHKDDVLGWHEFTVENNFDIMTDYFELYDSILNWIKTSVENPDRHARWIIRQEYITLKFRYERDYLMCVLRWS